MTDTDRLAELAEVEIEAAKNAMARGDFIVTFSADVTAYLISERLSLVDDNRELRAAAEPCPWCGHPPMCHKGSEGECAALHPGDGA